MGNPIKKLKNCQSIQFLNFSPTFCFISRLTTDLHVYKKYCTKKTSDNGRAKKN